MNYDFRFPDIGEGTTEGELSRWLISVGDEVEENQPVAEVHTDKVEVEISSPVSGTVSELRAGEGDTILVGSVLITFEVAGAERTGHTQADRQAETEEAPPAREPANVGEGRVPVRATPAVRRLARELDVDLRLSEGSGSGGRVTKEDVRQLAESSAEKSPEDTPVTQMSGSELEKDSSSSERDTNEVTGNGHVPGERVPIRGVRRGMFASMAQSMGTVAHCTTFDEADVTELAALRQRTKPKAAERGVHLTYLPFVVKAVVAALREFPELNASLDEEREELMLHAEYNIGIAIDTPRGLIVPVLKGADRKSILDLAHEISYLAERARSSALTPSEMRGATFTITSMGPAGGTYATPIINLPEVAAMGAHRIRRLPLVMEDDEIRIRNVMGMSLSFDHRLIDGATTSRFFKLVVSYLQCPDRLLVEMP